MTYIDPNTPLPPQGEPRVTETIETVVVRESNTGWWVAGVLGGLVLLSVLWVLFARGAGATPEDAALLQAQADAASAQAQADAVVAQSQIAGAQVSADIARADAARAQAEAARAVADARAAEARAATPAPAPVVIAPEPAPGPPVVTTSTPQN